MPQALGSRGRIIYQPETVFKQVPTPGASCQLLYFKSESLRLSRNLISSETLRGNRNPTKPAAGAVDVAGSIVVEMQAYITSLFKATLGACNTVGSTHTFTIGNELPSLFMEKGFTDLALYHRYSGCKVNRMSVSLTHEGFQDITFDFMGTREAVSGSSFYATPTDNGKASFDGFSVATIEEGGSPIAYVTAVDGLTIENNLDGASYVVGGAGERRWLPEGRVRVSGTLRALFESGALYTKALNSTKTSLKVVYQLGTGAGTAGNEYLEISVPELIYQPNAPVIGGAAGVVLELPFEAFYDTDVGASAIKIVVKNTQTSIA